MRSVRVYEYDIATSKHFRVVGLKGLRPLGVDHRSHSVDDPSEKLKYEEAFCRARRNLRDLILCNSFDYFCTFTFDGSKIDRNDYKVVKSALTKWFNNFRSRYAPNFRYVVVPEQHKNGSWHFHGVVAGIPSSEFSVPSFIQVRDRLSGRLLNRPNVNGYVRWDRYSKRFGFFDCSLIRSTEACAEYVSKYLFKNDNDIDVSDHLYFCSKGLNRPELVADVPDIPFPFDKPNFENEFCKTSWSSGAGVLGVFVPDWYLDGCSELRDPSPLSDYACMSREQLEYIIYQPLTFADLAGV